MAFSLRQMAMLALALFAGVAACLFAWQQQSSQRHELLINIQQREGKRVQATLDELFAQSNHFLTRAARDPRLLELMRTGDQSTAVQELAESRAVLGFQSVMLHDRSGEMLYLSDAPSRAGESWGLESFIKRQYSDNPLPMAEVKLRDKPTLILSHPLRKEGSVIGVLMLAYVLDETTLQALADRSDSSLRLHFSDGRELAAGEGTTRVALSWPVGAETETQLFVQLPSSIGMQQTPTLMLIFLSLSLLIGGYALWTYWQKTQRDEHALQQLVQAIQNAATAPSALLTAAQQSGPGAKIAAALRDVLHKQNDQQKQLQEQSEQMQRQQRALMQQVQQVQQERDSALHAPRNKSEFLSRMGDEITTPMNSMMGMLTLLSEHNIPREEKELLLVSLRSARMLTDNLNNILDFAKLDADLLVPRKQPFIIKEMVQSLVRDYEPLALEKKLKLTRNVHYDVPEQVNNDETRVRQILANLVGNAVRFTKEGEVGVFVDLWEKNGVKLLRFTVADTGLGIPKDAQTGLFESLDSRSKLNNASFAGRLRLIVCKQLAEIMGGEIGVASEPGKGSRFWFTIAL